MLHLLTTWLTIKHLGTCLFFMLIQCKQNERWFSLQSFDPAFFPHLGLSVLYFVQFNSVNFVRKVSIDDKLLDNWALQPYSTNNCHCDRRDFARSLGFPVSLLKVSCLLQYSNVGCLFQAHDVTSSRLSFNSFGNFLSFRNVRISSCPNLEWREALPPSKNSLGLT